MIAYFYLYYISYMIPFLFRFKINSELFEYERSVQDSLSLWMLYRYHINHFDRGWTVAIGTTITAEVLVSLKRLAGRLGMFCFHRRGWVVAIGMFWFPRGGWLVAQECSVLTEEVGWSPQKCSVFTEEVGWSPRNILDSPQRLGGCHGNVQISLRRLDDRL